MLIIKNDIRIRNAEISDAQILCNWWNDGAVMNHAGFPNGLGTTIEKVEEKLMKGTDMGGRRLIIEHGDKPIGEMSYRNIGSETAEIGIKICDFSRQDKGLGTVILNLFIRSLFKDLNFNKIVLDTDLDNKRAQHVYEKIGFKKIRVNHDCWKNQLGEMRSAVEYELVGSDFL